MTDWKPIPPTENQLAELFRLREERDRLRAALETVEWIDDYDESTGKFVFCPCCNREKKHGHYECRLEEALKETL